MTLKKGKPYGAIPHRRRKQGLLSESDFDTFYCIFLRLHTSGEDNSLRFPCQIGDLSGTGKKLSEDTETAKTAQNEMACLGLQRKEVSILYSRRL